MYSPVAPMWYFTSPEPRTLRGSTSSKPAKISSGGSLGDVGDHVETAAMAHAHDQFGGAEAGTSFENFIHQRDQRGDAFEREALAAEITLLHDLLEDIGADEQVENALLIFSLTRFGFHSLVDPAPAFGSVDVIDFDADGRGVDGAGFARVFAFESAIPEWGAAAESRGDRGRLQGIPIDGKALKTRSRSGWCHGSTTVDDGGAGRS